MKQQPLILHKETDTQRGCMTCLEPHSKLVTRLRLGHSSGLSVPSISAFPAEETSVVSDLEGGRTETEWGCPVSPPLSSTTAHSMKDASGYDGVPSPKGPGRPGLQEQLHSNVFLHSLTCPQTLAESLLCARTNARCSAIYTCLTSLPGQEGGSGSPPRPGF